MTIVKLADGLTALAPYMFANTGLVSFDIPASVTDVSAEGVFANNANLTTVNFGDGATGILGAKFFYECTALKEVALSSGITQLGKIPVEGTDYDGSGDIIGWEASGYGTSEPSYAFYGCTALEKVEIPGVYHIGAYAFYGCTSLKDVIFGEYLSVIGDYAFAECTGLEALDMSTTEVWTDGGNYPGKAEIGAFAFYNCSSIADLGLPYIIHFIKDGAFEGCNAIKKLSIGNIAPPPSGGFKGCPFRGWTSEQTIFFEYHTSAQRFNFITLPDYGVFPGFTSDWTKNHEAAIVFKDEV
ncbi:MAG: leucine-rich repeat domain-containing protein [Clostridia bacterium]|nr:leucine-rich repeat domain-containing protein [Clostridia bacterium]